MAELMFKVAKPIARVAIKADLESRENKNMDSVVSVSQTLAPERTRFLNRMFQRYDRLDVSIDDIRNNGDVVTAKLNVSFFNRNDDGSFYSAGRWNDVTLNATRQSGTWQKISW